MENTSLEVTATDHDKNVAAKSNYVVIKGEQANWNNSWVAAGGDITWNMLHYDVQLIGGMVLHDGKIAEMMTMATASYPPSMRQDGLSLSVRSSNGDEQTFELPMFPPDEIRWQGTGEPSYDGFELVHETGQGLKCLFPCAPHFLNREWI